MLLPLPLLAGLLVAFANCELSPALPGEGRLATLLPALLLLAVPTLLAIAALRKVHEEGATGRRGRMPPRALLRLSAWATPIVVHAIFFFGAYGDWIERLAWDSHLGRIVLGVMPAFVAELPRMPWSTLADISLAVRPEPDPQRLVERTSWPRWLDVAAMVRMRLGGPLLVAMPLLLFGAMLDLLHLVPELYSFVFSTAVGLLVGATSFLALAVAVLPFWFRFAFAVRPLPEPIGARLREVAAKLGFPGHRLYVMPTGMSSLNAMLVGPLPFGRCLCLTDGLLRELDADALAGVVAHEVGHARSGHPALLIALVVVVPMALAAPLRLVDLESMDVVVQAAVATVGLVVAWLVLRTLAHRFEHEADAASVAALGKEPCSRALLVVSRLAMPVEHGWFGRLFSLHPDEPRRWQLMARYESEPEFRATFAQRGRRLRQGIVMVMVAALGLGAFGSAADWRFEHVLWRLNAGDLREALQLATAIEANDVPRHWQEAWRNIDEDLMVAAAVAPNAANFDEAQAMVPAAAWPRGEAVLRARGPAAARPYFAMALAFTAEPTVVQRAVFAFCDAAAEGEAGRMAAMVAVIRRLGVPSGLEEVFVGG